MTSKVDMWQEVKKCVSYEEMGACQDVFAQVWDHQQEIIDKLKEEMELYKSLNKAMSLTEQSSIL